MKEKFLRMKFPQSVILVTLTILYLVSSALANFQNEDKSIFERKILASVFQNLQPNHFLNTYSNLEQNRTICDEDFNSYINEFKKLQPWALEMADASSKIPSGILEGNIADLGMYDECISIVGNYSTKNIQGRHCTYKLNIILPGNVTFFVKPKFAMCIPSSCGERKVSSIIKKVNENIHNIEILKNVNIEVDDSYCSNLEFEKWSTGSIVTLTIILLIVFFLLTCTIVELIQKWLREKYVNSKTITILSEFSLLNNALKIISTKVNPGSIPSIHGIRALSIMWVIYGHEIYFSANTSYVNFLDFANWLSSWKCIYLALGVFAVDTFLMLSGFLLSFLFLKKNSTGKKFNLLQYYLHRYIRLTPAMAALIFITTYIAPHLGSGPRWENDIVANVSAKCEESWWTFLLYMQNYVGEDPAKNLMCMGHLWYLSVDMQLFWLSPLILYPLSKKPKIGLIIWGLFFIASVITPGIIVSKYKLMFSTFNINLSDKIVDSIRKIYTVTHCRASPWLFGIFFGYIMTKHNMKPKREILITGWLTTILCFIFCTWVYLIFLDKNYEYNVTLEIIFASFSHFIWTMGVAWIIYVCHHGYGGVINTILSLPFFLPISKISYSLYLLHFLILNLKSGSSRLSLYFSNFTMFEGFLGDMLLCFILSFFFCIIFESPIIILEKMLFGIKRKRKEPQSQINQNIISQFENGNRPKKNFGNRFENRFQTGVDNKAFEMLEKGNTTIDPETNEQTTDL